MNSDRSTAAGRVVQISVNPQGGVPKHRIQSTQVVTDGVVGDKQRNRRFHGGPERAVCIFSYERIRELQDEGHPIDCGTTGENVAIGGIDWALVQPGDHFHIGAEVQLEVTRFTTPCSKIAASFIDGDFMRMSHTDHPGWSRVYTRVLRDGTIREGDAVRWISSTTTQSDRR